MERAVAINDGSLLCVSGAQYVRFSFEVSVLSRKNSIALWNATDQTS